MPAGQVRATLVAVAAGDEVAETSRSLRGELGQPHPVPLPEFPETMPGTTPWGRTVTHLAGLALDLSPHGFRLTAARAGTSGQVRRIAAAQPSLVARTADVLAGDSAGDTVLRISGPATLAAQLALPSGEPLLSDPGALRDVCEAWLAGMLDLVAATERSLPGARAILWIQEPELDRVSAGHVRSSSGYRQLAPWHRRDVARVWEGLAQRTPAWLPGPDAVQGTVAEAIAVAQPRERPGDWEALAPRIEAGGAVLLGMRQRERGTVASRASQIATPWRRLGLAAADLGRLIVCEPGEEAVGAQLLRRRASSARDLADALDVVRHDDLDALI